MSAEPPAAPAVDLSAAAVETGRYDPHTPWDDADWRARAAGWAAAELVRRGRSPGPGQDWRVRLRPWSVVFRIPLADGGPVWFKANPSGSRFEPALAAALARWTPGHVLAPLAVDAGRGWSLLPDGGPLLAEAPDGSPSPWPGPIRQYAAFQRALTAPDRVAGMAALGVQDLRPALLPAALDALLDAAADVLSPGERTELRALQPAFAGWCAELAASPVPGTLDHSDLHVAQVFAPGADGRVRFFDWGDAALAHPFTSLLVTARAAREEFGAGAVTALRDAYLAGWAGFGPDAGELRRLAVLACRTAPVGRAQSWNRVFPGNIGSAEEQEAFRLRHVAGWLRRLLDDPPL